MKCEEIKKKIIEFVDGGLSDVERIDIEKHLEECHRCRKEIESVKTIFSSAKQIKTPEYDEAFWNARYNIIFEKAQRINHQRSLVRRMKLGFGLIGIFLMIFASKAYYHKYRPPVPVNVPGISYYVPEEVLSEKTFPIPMNELKKIVDFLEPEEHMMILADYLR
ncbi:MAG: zf-HC2 domain-containing protein [Candidatus Omnitrophica bacterium]|nr:zf-HC2 domain-containing protein [Candidatus Omnitrophota bacterium]